jgi:hypothetical protein
VRNYIQTGRAKIMDQLGDVVAMHKDRYVTPVTVSEMSDSLIHLQT